MLALLALLVASTWSISVGCGGTTAEDGHARCSDCGSGGETDAQAVGLSGSSGQTTDARAGANGANGEPLPDGMGCPGLPYDGTVDLPNCVGAAYSCEPLPPPDMLIVLERSAAMAEPWGETTRWAAATEEVIQFVGFLPAGRFRVGLQVFTNPAFASEASICDVDGYVGPRVEITDAPDASRQIADVLETTSPASPSPVWPALAGSLQYAREWEPPEDSFTQIVLVAAGAPGECAGEASMHEVVGMVEAARGADPNVVTYVIDLDAPFDFDPIARAAGSLPIRIERDDSAQRVLEALVRIQAGLAMQWTVAHRFDLWAGPPTDGRAVDLSSGVVFADTLFGREVIPQVDSSEACAASDHGGWYYDNPEQPTQVDLCPCTRVRVGCPPNIEARWACDPETLEE